MEDVFKKKRKYMRGFNMMNDSERTQTGHKRAMMLNELAIKRAKQDKDGGLMLFQRSQPLSTSKLLSMQNIPNFISFGISGLMTSLMFGCVLPAPVTTYITSLMVGNVAHQLFSISPTGKKLLKTSTDFDNKSIKQQYNDFRKSVYKLTYVD